MTAKYHYNLKNKTAGVKVVKLPKPLSAGEELMAQQLRAYKIPFEREVKFHSGRKWRIDFVVRSADPPYTMLAIEIEGGIWNGGAHTRGTHFESDCIKYAEATLAGYAVLRFSTEQVTAGTAIDYIRRLVGK